MIREQIKELQETGMNWTKVASVLGISIVTLHQKSEYGIADTFTTISDEQLECEIREFLTRTPYSGETYVSGGRKGESIQVQTSSRGKSLKRIDGVA